MSHVNCQIPAMRVKRVPKFSDSRGGSSCHPLQDRSYVPETWLLLFAFIYIQCQLSAHGNDELWNALLDSATQKCLISKMKLFSKTPGCHTLALTGCQEERLYTTSFALCLSFNSQIFWTSTDEWPSMMRFSDDLNSAVSNAFLVCFELSSSPDRIASR